MTRHYLHCWKTRVTNPSCNRRRSRSYGSAVSVSFCVSLDFGFCCVMRNMRRRERRIGACVCDGLFGSHDHHHWLK